MGGSFLLEHWKKHPKLLVCCSLVVFLALALTFKRSSWTSLGSNPEGTDLPKEQAEVTHADVALNGTLENIHDRDVVWQMPGGMPTGGAKGVAFFAHGCNHKATHFWPASEACPSCLGLPEDVNNIKVALARVFAVIAVSSLGVCWDASMPPDASADIPDVVRVIQHWRAKHELEDVPLVAMGASSGGYLVSSVAHAINLDALAVMISSGVQAAFTARPDFGDPYPPTLFIHMPKDDGTAEGVRRSKKTLESQGVEAAEIRCREMKIGPDFLSARIEGLSKETSESIFNGLLESELVSRRGYLIPKYSSSWLPAVQGKGIVIDSEMQEKVQEELKLAFAWHEMTSEYAPEMMDWFEGVCVSRIGGKEAEKFSSGRCKSYS